METEASVDVPTVKYPIQSQHRDTCCMGMGQHVPANDQP